ncbi:MAG: ATP-binding protein [Clostridia bacterium]|nr:ATP-binding protein [Clostridia bacterium]
MTELALHILDIAKNSTRAKAKNVTISVFVSTTQNSLVIEIADDGTGMSEELLARVTDPFSTTRTTRKVGLGIPLFKQSSELCGGEFSIKSKLGEGTVTRASYVLNHFDRVPLGDLAGSIAILIGGSPEVDFTLDYRVDDRRYLFKTAEVREILEGIPLNEPEVLNYIQDMMAENIENINGGIII